MLCPVVSSEVRAAVSEFLLCQAWVCAVCACAHMCACVWAHAYVCMCLSVHVHVHMCGMCAYTCPRVPVRAASWFRGGYLLTVSSCGRKDKATLKSLFHGGALIPLMGLHPPDPITSQRLPLPTSITMGESVSTDELGRGTQIFSP